jgi:hypothetical protein
MRTTEILMVVATGCLYLLSYCGGVYAQPSSAESEPFSKLFESRYNAWKKALGKPTFNSLGCGKEWADILRLGPVAVPFLIDKLEKHLDSLNNREKSELIGAISTITWKHFARSEYPQGEFGKSNAKAKLYLEWWKEDRAKTPNLFAEAYATWKQLRTEGSSDKAQEAWDRMKNIGIDVLPLAMEKIRAGETELIPLISQVLRKEEVAKDATREEVLKWWQDNELKFRIPSTKEEAEEIYQKLQQAKSGKQTVKVPSETPSSEPESDISRQKPANWILPTVIAGIVVLAGVVFFLLLRRKK